MKTNFALIPPFLPLAACPAPDNTRPADIPVVAAPSAFPSPPPPDAATPPQPPQPAAPATERKFTGVVGKVDTGCYADAMCYMLVDGQRVVFGMGWSRETWGQVAPREPIESYVGRTVEVYCQQRGDECWLAGNKDYYVR